MGMNNLEKGSMKIPYSMLLRVNLLYNIWGVWYVLRFFKLPRYTLIWIIDISISTILLSQSVCCPNKWPILIEKIPMHNDLIGFSVFTFQLSYSYPPIKYINIFSYLFTVILNEPLDIDPSVHLLIVGIHSLAWCSSHFIRSVRYQVLFAPKSYITHYQRLESFQS